MPTLRLVIQTGASPRTIFSSSGSQVHEVERLDVLAWRVRRAVDSGVKSGGIDDLDERRAIGVELADIGERLRRGRGRRSG